MTMPVWLWNVLKWVNLVAVLVIVVVLGNMWLDTKISARINQSLSAYHQQYVAPLAPRPPAALGSQKPTP